MKDGKYTLYRSYDGKKTKIGSFVVDKNSINFRDESDELNIDMIPSGPISTRTEQLVNSMLNKEHNHYLITKNDSNGQWSSNDLEKADKLAVEKLYHIHHEGHRITDKPMSLKEISHVHGEVPKLESNGFRLVAHEEKPKN